MESQKTLSTLFLLADEPPGARLLVDDLHQWPDTTSQAIKTAGWLQEEPPATHVSCHQCDGEHVEEVLYLPRDPTSRAYLACPSCGRVEVPLERLRQFSIDWQRLAAWLAGALNTQKSPTSLLRERAWDLGRCSIGRDRVSVALVRGLRWDDAPHALSPTLAQSGLILTASPAIPRPNWLSKEARLAAVVDVVKIAGDKLVIDRAELETIAQPAPQRRSQKNAAQLTYPLPPGCQFEQVQMELTSDTTLRIRLPNRKPREFDYKQLGLADQRGGTKPAEKLWGTLEQFAVNNGVIDWSLSHGSTERQERLGKHIQRLKQVLQTFFETDREPFFPYNSEKTYRCRFTITDARFGQS